MGVIEKDPLAQLSLPPGFRFFPTDEELLVQYLCRQVAGHHFSLQVIGEIDLYKFDPWELPSKALFGEKEWYFFSPRDRKYPNGTRPNRVAGSGYWKATGTDKIITTEGRRVGIKKALVFYVGKAPKGTKTNWIMHEYRLIESFRKTGSSKLDDWVLCRIYKKSSGSLKPFTGKTSREDCSTNGSSSSSSSQLDDVLDSFPDIEDRFFDLPRMNSLKSLLNDDKIGFSDPGAGNYDWACSAGLSSIPELVPSQGLPNYGGNNAFVAAEDEVQSVFRNQSAGFAQQNSSWLTQGLGYNSGGMTHGFGHNSFEPVGLGFAGQGGGYGFRP